MTARNGKENQAVEISLSKIIAQWLPQKVE